MIGRSFGQAPERKGLDIGRSGGHRWRHRRSQGAFSLESKGDWGNCIIFGAETDATKDEKTFIQEFRAIDDNMTEGTGTKRIVIGIAWAMHGLFSLMKGVLSIGAQVGLRFLKVFGGFSK